MQKWPHVPELAHFCCSFCYKAEVYSLILTFVVPTT